MSKLTRAVRSIQENYERYQEGPLQFSKLDATLTRVPGFAENIDKILRSHPATMPHAVLPDFVGSLTTIKDTLLHSGNAVTEYCSRAFVESNKGSCLQEIVNKGRRFFKAKLLKALMNSIQRETSEAEN